MLSQASFTVGLLSKKKSYTEFLDDFFFIQMQGPDKKGHAQMAVRLTDEKLEPSVEEPLGKTQDPLPTLNHPSSPLESSTSSSNTVDVKATVNPTPSNNLLAPPTNPCRMSSSAESISSTHSSDPLCPTSKEEDKHECSAVKNPEEHDAPAKKSNIVYSSIITIA